MRLVRCTQCGSTKLVEEDGSVVCAYCQSRFAPQGGEPSHRNTVIGVYSDIQVLLLKCKNDPVNRRRYASLILDIDPSNEEAAKYLQMR